MRRTMRIGLAVCLMLAAALVAVSGASAAAKDSTKLAAAREGWPDTKAAARARGWVVAFNTGEKAMKEFLANEMAPKSLESRSLNQRVEKYQALREKYGKLALGSVVKSTPAELTVKLMDSSGSLHTFIFTAETEAPYRLVSVGIREGGHGGHGFGH